jgi:hypothetical protein
VKRLVAIAAAGAALAVPAGAGAAVVEDPFCVSTTACPAEQTMLIGPQAVVTGLDGGPTDGGPIVDQRQRIGSAATAAKKVKSKRKKRRARR